MKQIHTYTTRKKGGIPIHLPIDGWASWEKKRTKRACSCRSKLGAFLNCSAHKYCTKLRLKNHKLHRLILETYPNQLYKAPTNRKTKKTKNNSNTFYIIAYLNSAMLASKHYLVNWAMLARKHYLVMVTTNKNRKTCINNQHWKTRLQKAWYSAYNSKTSEIQINDTLDIV